MMVWLEISRCVVEYVVHVERTRYWCSHHVHLKLLNNLTSFLFAGLIQMEPGDLVLYESHSVVHGRPFPLKGKYYANVFIHFVSIDSAKMIFESPLLILLHSLMKLYHMQQEPDPEYQDNHESDLPPYVLDGSLVAEDFRAGEYDGEIPSENAMRLEDKRLREESGALHSHGAAEYGDLDTLIDIAKTDTESLFAGDNNGWQPIHEAARSGHLEVVEFLHSQGADINARTHMGHSPLQIVSANWGENHHLYHFLSELGAEEMGPDL